MVSYPLLTRSRTYGALWMRIPESRGQNYANIQTLANQAAIALENARLYQSTVRTAERFAILNESGAQISTSLEPEQIYTSVYRAAERVMPADIFVITLLDEAVDEVEAVYAVDKGKRQPSSRAARSETMSGRIMDTGHPILTNLEAETAQVTGIDVGEGDNPVSILAVPMSIRGRVIGLEEGKGLAHAQSVFGFTRLMVAAFGLGAGQAALERMRADRPGVALLDVDVTRISLADYPLPIYEADLDVRTGQPANALKLKQMIMAHHGVFIASPEYSASVTPILKNAIDWVSRVREREDPTYAAFKGRVFAIASASPGRAGGLRSLMALRQILELGCGALVIPEQVAIQRADSAFDEMDNIADTGMANLFRAQLERLVEMSRLMVRGG